VYPTTLHIKLKSKLKIKKKGGGVKNQKKTPNFSKGGRG
jgi:hypothetical protein